ncbi:hypothetical protein GOARA_087_00020 [Gordonia araii NBRC 100433]|uniref:Tox-REase-5 domain-containing protein n=1 Tax=Gordonia araii NBRC 100433 TaxID=1073574 RepID=G7H784_9ACTN|nr:Tox-REase-5 domain-containing protein [Gordonia araii]NNG99041.1 hypothetical protein [Gordonia araii NBRC 100433]GAB11709.1 hypothetical protein GOARA_087_00020 [Gordonia araii NBRC 100433]
MVLALAVALVVLCGLVVVVGLVPRTVTGAAVPSAAEMARMKLAAAQVGLVQTPGVRFTGRIVTPGGTDVDVDVVAGNTGELAGTVLIGGHEFELLTAAGRTFLTGDVAGWQQLNPPQSPVKLAGRPVEMPKNFFGVDFAVLAPGQLGRFLDPALLDGKNVTVGDPVVVNGRLATPITSGRVTTFVSDPRSVNVSPPPITTTPTALGASGPVFQLVDAGGAGAPLPLPEPPTIERIRIDSLTGGGQKGDKWAGADINTDMMNAAQTERFYRDYAGKISELRRATDPRMQVSGTATGRFSPSPCGATACTVTFGIGNRITADPEVTPHSVYANYRITISVNGAVVNTCSGSTAMPPNGSTQITCPAVYPPARGGGTIRAQIHVEATAFGKAEIDQLHEVVKDHAAAIRGLPPTERPGNGRFVVKKDRNMGGKGARVNAEHQSQVSGLPVAVEYEVEYIDENGKIQKVAYDGIDYHNKFMEEAKGQYDSSINKDGQFKPWIAEQLIPEIRRQLRALPDGYRLRISFLERRSMELAIKLYKEEGIDLSRVVIRHLPKEG